MVRKNFELSLLLPLKMFAAVLVCGVPPPQAGTRDFFSFAKAYATGHMRKCLRKLFVALALLCARNLNGFAEHVLCRCTLIHHSYMDSCNVHFACDRIQWTDSCLRSHFIQLHWPFSGAGRRLTECRRVWRDSCESWLESVYVLNCKLNRHTYVNM